MEKVLRSVGFSFLYVAGVIHEAKEAFHSYMFDLIFRDDPLRK